MERFAVTLAKSQLVQRGCERDMERFAVTAATGALGPVLVKLTALLGDEYKLQEGTRRDIMSIKSGLEPVHDHLRQLWGIDDDLDVACEDWMMEARELSYDMEDNIDRFTLRLERGESGFIVQRETTDHPFKDFVQSVKGASWRRHEMPMTGEANIFNRTKLCTDPRALFLHKDASELVGVKEKKKELIKLLRRHEMVCIVGFAGEGKTALADLVYHKIGHQFQCRAFVSVHPSPNMMKILGTILSQVTNGASSAGSVTEAAAEQSIINSISIYLADKRYLVIIDDIWHWEEWEVIRNALPKNNLGCKIIMTTRIKAIAEKCQTEQSAYLYKQYFHYADAEILSDMRLNKYFEGDTTDANAKGLSSKIVNMCDAMPLAVLCLWSAWAESHVQAAGDCGEWGTWTSQVLDGFLSSPSLKPLVQSLCLGFDDLSIQERTCLLYCSMYPPYYLIDRDCLVRKWIAEGFVSQQEVAEAYIAKLVSRNLLHPERVENTYRVHPLMLALLACKAKEDNFVTCGEYYHGPSCSSHTKQIRRLYLYTDRYPDEDVSHARSLVVLGPEPQLDGPDFKRFVNLRVLEIIGSKGLENSHLKDICDLIWLRYLGLKEAPITELPREIGRLQNLETLDVTRTRISKLPMEIGGLHNLGTLNISGTMVTELPSEIGELQNLKTLDACNTKMTGLPTEIEKVQYLKTLDISGTNVTELPREIRKLKHIVSLNICGTKVTVLPEEITKLERLENLDVSNTGVRDLPKGIGKLQKLRTLDVRNTRVRELSWDVPNSLSVLVGDQFSTQVVKLPLDVSTWRNSIIPSSLGAKCKQDLSVLVLFNRFGSWCEVLPFPMLRVAGRHMNVPQWVKQDLCDVSSLDITLYKLEEDDLEFLKKMPNLQALELRFEILPREPIAITAGGFLKLETFYVDCRLPRVTFQLGSMPVLKHLEFKFYTGTTGEDYYMGIAHLPSLEKVVFRCSEHYTSACPGISPVIEVVRNEAEEHANQITFCVNDKDKTIFRKEAVDKSNESGIEVVYEDITVKRERLLGQQLSELQQNKQDPGH